MPDICTGISFNPDVSGIRVRALSVRSVRFPSLIIRITTGYRPLLDPNEFLRHGNLVSCRETGDAFPQFHSANSVETPTPEYNDDGVHLPYPTSQCRDSDSSSEHPWQQFPTLLGPFF